MSTTIKIKNSNVVGRIPNAGALETAELALNLKDQKLYSKDADGNVFEIGGRVDSGNTPPGSGNEVGDLFWDGDFLLVWNGSEWVAVGESDLDYVPAADGGEITNTNGEGVELPLVDDTNAGLMSPDEHKKLGDMPAVISGPNQPSNPSLGDIWIDTNDCPPTINIWNDCENPGNPSWTPIGGGEVPGCQQGPVQIIGDSEIGSTLTATGGNGTDEGSGLTATYNWTGAKTGTGATIVADVEGDYTVTAEITCTDGSTLSTSATKTVSDSYVDMVNNTPPVIAVVGEGPDGAYDGNSLYVVTPATVINGDTPVIVENQWFKNGASAGTGQLYSITAADAIGTVLTCKQLFRDARTNELLSDASNGITIVARPADAITFNAVITDDGTPNANTPGHVLTASAQNIVGGEAPQEYSYKWLVGGLTMGDQKTLNIIASFVGKIVSCEVTVAEPDGSNPETRTATYANVIEIAGTIDTPSVLAPADGAGSGDVRYLKSDRIIEVEDLGGGQTKLTLNDSTDLSDIESVGGELWMTDGSTEPSGAYNQTPYTLTTSAITNVSADAEPILTFADPNPDLQYFLPGDVVGSGNPTQTQPVMYSTTTGAIEDGGTILRSNLSKATGGAYGVDATDTWTVTEAGSLKLSFYNNAVNGAAPNTATFNFSSNDGVTCSQGSSWDMVGSQKLEITFTFPGPGSFDISYFISDITPFNNHILYYLDYGSEASTSRWTPNSGPAVVLNTNTNMQIGLPEDITVVSTGYPTENTMTVSGGTWNNGDVVEYETKGGKGTIDSVSVVDKTITLTNSADRDERWIGENKGGILFSAAGPSITDDPLLTADVELLSSNFATTPPGEDTLSNIVWELNGVEQNAGTSNPYKPSGLALNTTYTVRVKHQGNTLEDSAWSASTTFTTGATRNLYTYYQERIAALVTRIEELEGGA